MFSHLPLLISELVFIHISLLIIDSQVMIKRLLALLRSKGCTSEDLEFSLEFESESQSEFESEIEIEINDREVSSGSSSDGVVYTDPDAYHNATHDLSHDPSHDATHDATHNAGTHEESEVNIITIIGESVPGDHDADQYLDTASNSIQEVIGTFVVDNISI